MQFLKLIQLFKKGLDTNLKEYSLELGNFTLSVCQQLRVKKPSKINILLK